MTPIKPSAEVREKYLADASSEDERVQVETWVRHAVGGRTRSGVDLEAVIRGVEQGVRQRQAPVHSRPAAGSSWRRWGLSATAACALGVGLAAWWIADGREVKGTSLDAGRTYRTAAGQQATVSLADGSEVHLAPYTTVTVSADFGHADRTVTVQGRAVFRVVPQGGNTFEVRTGQVTTRVLGTEFEVVNYHGADDVRVAVASGKVSMHRNAIEHAVEHAVEHAMTLSAGMVGTMNDSVAVSRAVDDIANYTAWRSGSLVFRSAPAEEVLNAVADWYGVRFQLADSTLMRDRLTVRVNTTSRSAALATIEQNLNVEAQIVEDSIVKLVPKRTAKILPAGIRKVTPASATPFREVGR